MPRQRLPRLGQVFLTDRRIQQRIVNALSLQQDDVVLEIGAGPGNMTALLAASGAKVVAVEVDPAWAEPLRQRLEAAGGRVEVLQADILGISIGEVARHAGRQRIKVFGNVPYYITSPILLHLFRSHASISEIVVMVQEEVARRITAEPGDEDYGLLTVTCRYYTQARMLFSIPARAFRPVPKVDSALLRMVVAPQRGALGITDENAFWKWMRAAFAQKRKTLVNNWKALCDAEKLRAAMEKHGMDVRARAETLSLSHLAALYRELALPAV
jgi:16S rRNA (adenine1518-N6/adenine1519-N6)-dimethyltransferase